MYQHAITPLALPCALRIPTQGRCERGAPATPPPSQPTLPCSEHQKAFSPRQAVSMEQPNPRHRCSVCALCRSGGWRGQPRLRPRPHAVPAEEICR